jgi:hypothetical protein
MDEDIRAGPDFSRGETARPAGVRNVWEFGLRFAALFGLRSLTFGSNSPTPKLPNSRWAALFEGFAVWEFGLRCAALFGLRCLTFGSNSPTLKLPNSRWAALFEGFAVWEFVLRFASLFGLRCLKRMPKSRARTIQRINANPTRGLQGHSPGR